MSTKTCLNLITTTMAGFTVPVDRKRHTACGTMSQQKASCGRTSNDNLETHCTDNTETTQSSQHSANLNTNRSMHPTHLSSESTEPGSEASNIPHDYTAISPRRRQLERNSISRTRINSIVCSSHDPPKRTNIFYVLEYMWWWLMNKILLYSRYMNNRAQPGHAYIPTSEEHIANMFTHGLLVLPSVVGTVWMLSLASNEQQRNIALIYGCSLFILFTVSTTFHILSYANSFHNLKNFFHIGDRAVIYIFIASSYTPWLTLKDYNGWGMMMLWVVWISALLGIFYQYTFHEQYKWLETVFYLLLGVCPSVVCFAMKENSGIYELALGGSVYISGVIFFKCDGVIPFAHAIWHCFVTLGAICHYQAVCTYLLGIHNEMPNELTS